MYNKQEWKDEIPDLTRPIMDSSTGKQKTDPQTGRPLFELVQVGTRITSTRLNNLEGGIEAAHTLVERLGKELGGNFIAPVDGTMGLLCTAQGLKVTWTAGIAYVGGRRYQVATGEMPLNPTQGQYLYVDVDGVVKKTTSQATAKAGLLLFYVATDTSGVISTTDQRVNISLEEILKKIENMDIPDASLTVKGKTSLSSTTNSELEDRASTPKAVKAAYDRGSEGVTAAQAVQTIINNRDGYGTTTNSGNTYAVTLSPAPAAYVDGLRITVKINVANTGAVTINVNGLGSKSVLKSNGSVMTGNALRANSVYSLVYNGTAFILQGEGGEYGTAVAGDVRAGKTIGTDAGLVTGTLAERATTSIMPSDAVQNFPSGIYPAFAVQASPSPPYIRNTQSMIVQVPGNTEYQIPFPAGMKTMVDLQARHPSENFVWFSKLEGNKWSQLTVFFVQFNTNTITIQPKSSVWDLEIRGRGGY